MNINLRAADRYVLGNLHGNARSAREVRQRLRADGLQFCSQCAEVLPLDAFKLMSRASVPAGRQYVCRACDDAPYNARPIRLLDRYDRDADGERAAARKRHSKRVNTNRSEPM